MKKNKPILLLFVLLISSLGISQNVEKLVKRYHSNGQLEMIGNTMDGNETGEWKFYWVNGQLGVISPFVRQY